MNWFLIADVLDEFKCDMGQYHGQVAAFRRYLAQRSEAIRAG
jgi:hypothetical protein